MIVCYCFGTTDQEIRAAFAARGHRKCPARQGCGSCADAVRQIAREVRQATAGTPVSAPRAEPR
jgi:bacterioferritin-associated ferredoxin